MLNLVTNNPVIMQAARNAGKRISNVLNQITHDETGEVNIVATVVLIGIAVGLALLFKGQIETLLKTLFGSITGRATNAVSGN